MGTSTRIEPRAGTDATQMLWIIDSHGFMIAGFLRPRYAVGLR